MTAGAGETRVAVLYTPVDDTLRGVVGKMRVDMDLAVNAEEVARTLVSSGREARCFPFGSDPVVLAAALREYGAGAVFNLSECPCDSAQKEAHGAALLELLGIPYTGNGPFPLAVCNDKGLTKRILVAMGLPTPPFRVYESAPRGRSGLSFPVVVKPACEDGSAGITEESVVDDEAGLKARVDHVVVRYRQGALAEEWVGGREFNVAVLGNGTEKDPYRVLPPAELVYRSPKWRVCSFESKWDRNHPAYDEISPECPAKIPASLARRLVATTLACAKAFVLRGYSRVDYRMNRRGKLFILEVNPNPDIGSGAGFARAARAQGMSHEALILEILRLGLALGKR